MKVAERCRWAMLGGAVSVPLSSGRLSSLPVVARNVLTEATLARHGR